MSFELPFTRTWLKYFQWHRSLSANNQFCINPRCVSVLTIFLHPSKPCVSALVISLPQLWLFSLSHLYTYLNYASFLYISALYCTFLCLLYPSLYVPALSPLCPIQIPASPVPFSILTKKNCSNILNNTFFGGLLATDKDTIIPSIM